MTNFCEICRQTSEGVYNENKKIKMIIKIDNNLGVVYNRQIDTKI